MPNAIGRHRAGRSRPRFAVLASVLALVAVATPVGARGAGNTGPAFTGSKLETRVHLNNGVDDPVDSRTVTVTVSQTQQLRERQGITVSWSGAHPTGGLISDPTLPAAAFEEYPVVVMECRGVDSTSVPAAQQVSPETCFTQSADERYGFSSSFVFPPFRMDRYSATPDREYSVNAPDPFPTSCSGQTADYWVPFKAANGTVYPGGFQGCGGIAPEQSEGTTSGQPGSTTYGVSDVNGNGNTQFIVQTEESNASLGCSATVACTLEVIPIEGISCDPNGTAPAPDGMVPAERPSSTLVPLVQGKCEDNGQYPQGSFNGNQVPDYSSTTGQYWYLPSNWRGRISVPLSFAQSANVCNSVANHPTALVYGSEAALQATQQWAPALCLDPKLFNLGHVQTSEPEAKNLLSRGNVEAVFQSEPPATPFAKPTVQAPSAVTGFAIAFAVDGKDGHPYPSIRLDARLLAKLMSESYEGCFDDCLSFPELTSNPPNMTVDPEFQALNPGIPTATTYAVAASTLSFMSVDSDVMTALTAYINDDPEARSFLDGRPDPWGMVVNPAYAGISLPVSRWPLLDTHVATAYGQNNPCVSGTGAAPWLPLVASPLENPALIALNMQYDINASQTQCINAGTSVQKLGAVGRENAGTQFLLGVVSLADAARYQLRTAELETQRTTNFTTVFSDARGRSFAAPTTSSLTAAAKMLQPDDTAGTWTVPYQAMRTTPAGLNAYPGIMLISTDVPTRDLPKKDAVEYGQLLTFIAGPGQTPGVGTGNLAAGYLPITSANGLGALLAYTKAAAAAVTAQQCVVPYPSGKATPAPSCNLPATPPATQSSAPSAPKTPNAPTPSVSAASTTKTVSSAPTSSAPSSSSVVLQRTGKTVAIKAGVLGVALPVMALLAILGGAASLLTRRRGH